METASVYEATASKREVSQNQRAWEYIRELCCLSADALSKTAITDGSKEYTYELMFEEWERYAAVFSALGMTEEQGARVGILGSPCIETIFSFYSLNMVGAEISLVSSWAAFNFTRVKETIADEGLTDFILTDDLVQQDLVRELLTKRKELGLRHVIVLHVPIAGPAAIPLLTAAQEAKYSVMAGLYHPIYMETLLEVLGSHPVHYASREKHGSAFILHTSGTTSGTGKPVPLSDGAMNAAVARFMMMKDISLPYDHLVTSIMVDLSNSYGIIDQVHLPFAMGGTVVVIPFGMLNPWFYKAVSTYRISFLFTVNSMIERWMKLPKDTDFDFSSLQFVALGGTAVSAAEKRRYHEFIEAHSGKNVTILNGYGLSELGAACCLSTPDLDDESIGYPMPEIDIRLCDDETGRFFSPRGKTSEGVLYIRSNSMASSELDGKEVVKMKVIDDEPYVCTNDIVRVDEDGRITYLGRANRFFLRDEGRKYESGRVEAEFSRQETIENCGIVPVFLKSTHESVPMLCVKTLDGAGDAADVILHALRQVFIEEKTLSVDYVPSRVMLADRLPLNINGKVDLFQLGRGLVAGDKYTVEPVRENDMITDFKLVACEEGPSDIVEMAFDEISDGMRHSMSTNRFMEALKKESPTVSDFSEALFGDLDSMNQMYQETMRSMFGAIGQAFPVFGTLLPVQMPETIAMREMMPAAVSMVPGMRVMARHMQRMSLNAPTMMMGMTQAMQPLFFRQQGRMLSNMAKMNHASMEMSRQVFESNRKMTTWWLGMPMPRR